MLPKFAIYRQHLSTLAKICQNLPKVAKRCQKLPKVAKSCHKLPTFTISCQIYQNLPKVAKSCQHLLKDAKSCQKLTKVDKKKLQIAANDCQQLPTFAISANIFQRLPKVANSCKKLPYQHLPKVSKSALNPIFYIFVLLHKSPHLCCSPRCRGVSWEPTNTNKLDPLPETGEQLYK